MSTYTSRRCAATPPTPAEVTAAVEAFRSDGIVAHRDAFARAWGERMHADILAAFEDARSREGGAAVRAHLHARVVDELVPIVQKHTIEGLVTGAP